MEILFYLKYNKVQNKNKRPFKNKKVEYDDT